MESREWRVESREARVENGGLRTESREWNRNDADGTAEGLGNRGLQD